MKDREHSTVRVIDRWAMNRKQSGQPINQPKTKKESKEKGQEVRTLASKYAIGRIKWRNFFGDRRDKGIRTKTIKKEQGRHNPANMMRTSPGKTGNQALAYNQEGNIHSY